MFKIKNRYIAIFLAIVIMVTIVGCNKTNQQEETNIVAKVNDKPISKEEFDRNFKIVEIIYNQRYGEKFWSMEIDNKTGLQIIQEQTLENLIRREILAQVAIEEGIEVSQEEVNELYDNISSKIENNEELKKYYEENEDFIKKQLKSDIYAEKYKIDFINQLDLDDKKVEEEWFQKYPVEVKASHILLKDKEKAKEILNRVKQGEDFAELAKQYSEDPGSKDKGGDVGYFKRGDMLFAFERAAFSLKEGEISDLVQTDFGYHIIKVQDIKSFQELKGEIQDENQLEAEKTALIETIKESKFTERIEELKKEASIEKFDNIN